MSKESLQVMDEILASLPARAKRLTITMRCAAFAAVARGFPHGIIAKALNISPSAVSYIANSRNPDSRRRYADVLARYESLGHDEFCARYLDDALTARFREIACGVDTSEEIKPKYGLYGLPDPKANKYADRPFRLQPLKGPEITLAIGFRGTNQDMDRITDENLTHGYAWRQLSEKEVNRNRYDIQQDEFQWSSRRWKGSALALDGAFEAHGLDAPLKEFKQYVAETPRLENSILNK